MDYLIHEEKENLINHINEIELPLYIKFYMVRDILESIKVALTNSIVEGEKQVKEKGGEADGNSKSK